MSPGGFAGLDPCVHCGFCLQSCPTFLVTGDEADGPRGRIVLMRALARGARPPTDENLRAHLDRCLGCRGCEPVCPSGVRYGPALEAAREMLGAVRRPPLAVRAVLATMAEPLLRRPVLTLARTLRPIARRLAGGSRLGFALGMLAATRAGRGAAGRDAEGRGGTPDMPATPVPRRLSPSLPVALFRGCIMEGLFPHVHVACQRTLWANGYELVAVPGQSCCGALHAHAGLHAEATRLAEANLRAFAAAPDALVAVNSAGCGAMLREYPRLFSGGPHQAAARALAARARDVTEVLADRGPRRGGTLALSVAYDPPCHLLHAQGVAGPPLQVLDAIPGLTRVSHTEAELCCGSAGIYGLQEPELSRAVLARKTTALRAAAPDVVATGNPGCAMQIGAGLSAEGSDTPVMHPVELLDLSYAAGGLYHGSEAALAAAQAGR